MASPMQCARSYTGTTTLTSGVMGPIAWPAGARGRRRGTGRPRRRAGRSCSGRGCAAGRAPRGRRAPVPEAPEPGPPPHPVADGHVPVEGPDPFGDRPAHHRRCSRARPAAPRTGERTGWTQSAGRSRNSSTRQTTAPRPGSASARPPAARAWWAARGRRRRGTRSASPRLASMAVVPGRRRCRGARTAARSRRAASATSAVAVGRAVVDHHHLERRRRLGVHGARAASRDEALGVPRAITTETSVIWERRCRMWSRTAGMSVPAPTSGRPTWSSCCGRGCGACWQRRRRAPRCRSPPTGRG